MESKLTLTVGIPAYNEGSNIAGLLKELLLQRADTFSLEKIIVASDGSEDDTVAAAQAVGHEDVIGVVDNAQRKGLGPRLNQLMEMATTDIVVLLNADIRIKSPDFLERITAPVRENKADLVSCNMLPLDPETTVEKALVFGYGVKNSVFERQSDGQNAFTCHGAARALNRTLYAKLRFPTSVGEDTYSYLFALFNGFRYAYVHETAVSIRLPQTVHDQFRQSARFYNNGALLRQHFPSAFVHAHVRLPWASLLRELMFQGLKHPFRFLSYAFIQAGILLRVFASHRMVSQTWDISQSSKSIRA